MYKELFLEHHSSQQDVQLQVVMSPWAVHMDYTIEVELNSIYREIKNALHDKSM